MLALMDLRPGNYIHPAAAQEGIADTSRYLRVIAIDLPGKKVVAKEDFKNEPETFTAAGIYGCSLEALTALIGGLSFDGHSLLIKGPGEVLIVHENGSPLALPHIRYVHQFQNLFRSLTGEELPFNLPSSGR